MWLKTSDLKCKYYPYVISSKKHQSGFFSDCLLLSLLSLFGYSKAQNVQSSIIMNMPYHDARKIILRSGWEPVLGNTLDENIGIPAIIFRNRGYIEVDDCTSAGVLYCTFYFQNKKGQYLRVGTHGEDDGPNARLQTRIFYAKIQDTIDYGPD
jgi:hypothetical protein